MKKTHLLCSWFFFCFDIRDRSSVAEQCCITYIYKVKFCSWESLPDFFTYTEPLGSCIQSIWTSHTYKHITAFLLDKFLLYTLVKIIIFSSKTVGVPISLNSSSSIQSLQNQGYNTEPTEESFWFLWQTFHCCRRSSTPSSYSSMEKQWIRGSEFETFCNAIYTSFVVIVTPI